MIFSYTGPEIDDDRIISHLPEEIAAMLRVQNGYISANCGLHVRGACVAPPWHSLRVAWEGEYALHQLFESVLESDIPIAEDCFGDQFLIRDGRVLCMSGETGEIEDLNLTWPKFLHEFEAEPIEFLALQPLVRFSIEGGTLQPGELLSVYPPFVAKEGGASLRPISNLARRLFLANFARQIANMEDGQQIEIVVSPLNQP